MNPQDQLCPNCGANGKDNLIGVHSQKEGRYRCKQCQKTFSERVGTAYYGIKKEEALFTIVITLLAYGCPPQAIVQAYGLDRRTVQRWFHKAGRHSQRFHAKWVWSQKWDLIHVQADEIKVRVQGGIMWMTLAIMVSSRLWLGGAVDTTRSKAMIVECLQQVACCALCRPLLLAVDGLNMYKTALKKAFRSRHRVGIGGRLKFVEWGNVILTQVVKARGNKRGNINYVVTLGTAEQAQTLRQRSKGGRMINSAFIERFNATIRQRVACLTRRSRAAAKDKETVVSGMYLMGCVYNFCTNHRSLAEALYFTPRRRHWIKRTPAMAASLTDHRWTLEELLKYKIVDGAA